MRVCLCLSALTRPHESAMYRITNRILRRSSVVATQKLASQLLAVTAQGSAQLNNSITCVTMSTSDSKGCHPQLLSSCCS
mmetsp:Transcript_41797/g.63170  ORF Transcript_41797/g.63170 Transcript_41797/m.63170 type:complete len:80 (-) Transcript_41797:133-372(-)